MQKKFPNQQNRFMRLEVFSLEVENCPHFLRFVGVAEQATRQRRSRGSVLR